mgnify:CR=1 FL=1
MDFNFPSEYEFFNIKTGERRILTAKGLHAKHMINGFVLSSNLSPNASRGQDFGWRLSAPTLKTIKTAQRTPSVMREVAQAKGVNPGAVKLTDMIEFLVDSYNNQLVAEEIDADEAPAFQEEYEQSIKGL